MSKLHKIVTSIRKSIDTELFFVEICQDSTNKDFVLYSFATQKEYYRVSSYRRNKIIMILNLLKK